MKHLSRRTVFAIIALLCLLLLTAAWHAQHGPARMQPCPLCILQRYAFILLGALCAAAALHGPQRTAAMVYAIAGEWIALAGLALAVWQVAEGGDMLSCADDPVGVFVNGLPTANWWPEFFFANGGCADRYPPMFGLEVPVWSLLWFAVFSMALSAVSVLLLRERLDANAGRA
jgi:disulfide bond formation protein DsbB